ncbi:hypothetical protein QFC21_001601 [Naganishia friedmannii]|uniref:Uncharacterized protein n=1 Tax=Naganishia friedmannii TaxID=89922 RepID=A0ACC2W2Z3_9TREE|nr:hypothetical protein QFC21_001601 [Naganishia friedmannii]
MHADTLDRNSFLPLSDIALPSTYTLHPKSVNPCHDLVALYRPLSIAEITANQPHVPPFLRARMAQQAAKEKANSLMPSMVNGKQKEENTEQKIRIGLWRASSGRHVWDADVVGSALLAMAWSLDGLYLSVLIKLLYSNPSEEFGLKLLHLSVQDGSLVHNVPLVVSPSKIADLSVVDMEWCESTAKWPQDAHKGFSARLQTPILREDMLLAKSGTRLRRYCDTIMKGLESCWHVWRKGVMEELTERLDDLESCAADNGTSRDSAMADLLRLLVAGRCGDAVSQFMGGKLTDGALNKWMSAYDDSVEYIHQTLSYGVFPAVERLLLLLEELKGWSMYKRGYDLDLETSGVEECIDWARYLAIRVMDMSRDVTREAEAFREFGKWLKYEISRATMQDAEDLAEAQTPKHDVASVASYLEMLTEKASTLPGYFLVDSERLAGQWAQPQLPAEDDARRSLPVVLKELMISLRGTSENSSDLDIQLPCVSDDDAFAGDSQSATRGLFAKERREIFSAYLQPKQTHVTPTEPGKDPLWSIADVLLSKVEKLVSAAIKDRTLTEVETPSRRAEGWCACRTAESGLSYEVLRNEQNPGVVHVRASSPEVSSFYTRTFRTGTNTNILNLDFFDDEQLVIVLQVNDGESSPGAVYLATVCLTDLQLMEGERYKSSNLADWPAMLRNEDQDSRRIGTVRSTDGRLAAAFLALNGRKGRRFACVGVQTNAAPGRSDEPVGTKDVMIFDMDENEGIEEGVGDESEQQGDQTAEQQEDQNADGMDIDE